MSALYLLLASSLLTAVPVHALVAVSAGSTACANLTSSLGSSKVVSSPLDPEYIATTQDYWNARQSAYSPTCIVYVESAQDVSVSLQAIRAADSRFAIKSGGHNPNTFFSSVDGGVLVSLEQLTSMSYDASTTLATYEPGSNWGDLYEYYQGLGRTVMGGRLAGVGTGLALGGGLSYLSPQYGIACDSFRELEVVLPSGDIVTASETSNADLFLGLRGGGGNAYGVVTKYTVQSRPIGNFYAGNILFLFEQCDTVLEAIHDFIAYNTDAKATILPTYEKLSTPDLTLNLDEIITLFLVYDGEDPGTAFDNFTSIPHIVDTLGPKTYVEVANLPVPFTAQLTRADNVFRSGVHHIEDDSYRNALQTWRDWAESNKGSYIHTGFYLYPVARSLTDASKSQGGDAMQLPDGPWFWTAYDIATPPTLVDAVYNATQESFRAMVEATPDASDLPIFLNEAAWDQDPLATFSTFSELQQIKAKYDPDGFFAQKTGGWSFE
ncbi:putative FAD-binding PCMH-type domain-containing protein [Seiridium cardinale]|uniref:FAD-binding PCMH-type domain-containing protein n=1 Tax=Seiridium cardinale TaxID=138064 RepID=A0ABR2XQ78_9PEZI